MKTISYSASLHSIAIRYVCSLLTLSQSHSTPPLPSSSANVFLSRRDPPPLPTPALSSVVERRNSGGNPLLSPEVSCACRAETVSYFWHRRPHDLGLHPRINVQRGPWCLINIRFTSLSLHPHHVDSTGLLSLCRALPQ